jgi:hypothetical protein
VRYSPKESFKSILLPFLLIGGCASKPPETMQVRTLVEAGRGSEIVPHERVIKEAKDISLNVVVRCVILY